MLQQGGRAGRDRQAAEVLILRLAGDEKNAGVQQEVKSACATAGCLRARLLALFDQVPVGDNAHCCSGCHPGPPHVELIVEDGKRQVVRIAGTLAVLKTELEVLASTAAASGPSLLALPSSVLSGDEIGDICRNWPSLDDETKVKALLRRSALPDGIMAALQRNRQRQEKKKEDDAEKERRKRTAGSTRQTPEDKAKMGAQQMSFRISKPKTPKARTAQPKTPTMKKK